MKKNKCSEEQVTPSSSSLSPFCRSMASMIGAIFMKLGLPPTTLITLCAPGRPHRVHFSGEFGARYIEGCSPTLSAKA